MPGDCDMAWGRLELSPGMQMRCTIGSPAQKAEVVEVFCRTQLLARSATSKQRTKLASLSCQLHTLELKMLDGIVKLSKKAAMKGDSDCSAKIQIPRHQTRAVTMLLI